MYNIQTIISYINHADITDTVSSNCANTLLSEFIRVNEASVSKAAEGMMYIKLDELGLSYNSNAVLEECVRYFSEECVPEFDDLGETILLYLFINCRDNLPKLKPTDFERMLNLSPESIRPRMTSIMHEVVHILQSALSSKCIQTLTDKYNADFDNYTDYDQSLNARPTDTDVIDCLYVYTIQSIKNNLINYIQSELSMLAAMVRVYADEEGDYNDSDLAKRMTDRKMNDIHEHVLNMQNSNPDVLISNTIKNQRAFNLVKGKAMTGGMESMRGIIIQAIEEAKIDAPFLFDDDKLREHISRYYVA